MRGRKRYFARWAETTHDVNVFDMMDVVHAVPRVISANTNANMAVADSYQLHLYLV